VVLAGTALLAMAAALIALLSRNEEHQLRSRMLDYSRRIFAIMGSLPFLAVLVLLLVRSRGRLDTVFLGLGSATLVLLVPMAIAWIASWQASNRTRYDGPRGNTPAAWTGVILCIAGFLIGGAALIEGHRALMTTGAVLIVASVIIGGVMRLMGLGRPTKEPPEAEPSQVVDAETLRRLLVHHHD
jgi:hypothetical protein